MVPVAAAQRRRLRPEFARAAGPAVAYSDACRGPLGDPRTERGLLWRCPTPGTAQLGGRRSQPPRVPPESGAFAPGRSRASGGGCLARGFAGAAPGAAETCGWPRSARALGDARLRGSARAGTGDALRAIAARPSTPTAQMTPTPPQAPPCPAQGGRRSGACGSPLAGRRPVGSWPNQIASRIGAAALLVLGVALPPPALRASPRRLGCAECRRGRRRAERR